MVDALVLLEEGDDARLIERVQFVDARPGGQGNLRIHIGARHQEPVRGLRVARIERRAPLCLLKAAPEGLPYRAAQLLDQLGAALWTVIMDDDAAILQVVNLELVRDG